MERIELETAAAKYAYLRGLIAVPGGALFVLAALANWEVGPLRHAWAFPAALLATALACLGLARYYNMNYGRVTLTTRAQVVSVVAGAAAAGFIVGSSLLLRSRADWSLDLPVNPIAISIALAMLAIYAIGVGLKPHHVVIWGTLLAAGAIPVWRDGDPSNVGLVLAGLAFMANGVFDHRLFVHTFGPRTRAAHDA